ncbi:MAG: DNA polymerase III subunit delta' [Acidobacteriota bacterium]|nr:DNA polymerase III subunit delta' [Acidobacteriota bacterium]
MFDSVYGHDRLKKILSRMVEKNNLHHGLLFYGPHGIGKRLTAQCLSRAMLCEKRTGCGECGHCHKFDSGNHPDYKEIAPDGNDIKVDQVREISENLHFRPFEARCRCIVIDGTERFREEAANAFLKSLEEPPEYVYFILIASDVKALLATIRSRCQKMAFQSLTEDDKTRILTQKFNKQEALARRLAAISFRQLETDEEAWDIFREDVRRAMTWLRLMLDEGHALDYFQDIQRDKIIWPRFQDHLMATVRELTLLANGFQPQHFFSDFAGEMIELAGRADAAHWRETWEELVRLQGKRRLHLNQGLWFNTQSVSGLGLREKAERTLKQRLAKTR